MSEIISVHAREIIDSRGNPTVEAELRLSTGVSGRAAVPSGASTGAREALELRDGEADRFGGKGVRKAVSHITGELQEALRGMDADDQEAVDRRMIELDGTANKGRLGANAILAVSLACAHAAARDQSIPLYRLLGGPGPYRLPVPMINVLNGGEHADNSVDMQEFMLMPVGAPDMAEAVRWGAEIFHRLARDLRARGLNTAVGDEGGFAPNLENNEQALEIVLEAIRGSGFEPGRDVYLGLDIASSELYRDGRYHLESEGRSLSSEEFVELLEGWVDRYPILSIEDGMAGGRLGRLETADRPVVQARPAGRRRRVRHQHRDFPAGDRAGGIANAILIKLNQIGTVTETLEAIRMAQESDYRVVISHRSGETEDTSIADLAVAVSAGQIKTGSLSRSDRVAKYNQLLRIAEELGEQGSYAGTGAFCGTESVLLTFRVFRDARVDLADDGVVGRAAVPAGGRRRRIAEPVGPGRRSPAPEGGKREIGRTQPHPVGGTGRVALRAGRDRGPGARPVSA